ncbi:kinase-like protein [Dichomitus squalens LYAD-421 SS1]|uniref:kinase-like protein n=1 Tax=Dichomitus squalens (strain LYAD-421) TaxID=732165 RepID=UPI00044150B4|nr:kinase-like protein [Dichomitus squalens LYAD-421 SS1]EJF63595.1 kinase-like protein [Dichomitus squalens LYAD-421 SS1]
MSETISKDNTTGSSDEIACQFPDEIFKPSRDAIDGVLRLLGKTLKPLGEELWSRNTFYDLGDGRMAKVGPTVKIYEARAMHFVRSYTSIPVPDLYMVFEHDDQTYIVMELVDGISLRDATHTTNADGSPNYGLGPGLIADDEVTTIIEDLKNIVEELRELGRRFPPKNPWFGAWPEGPLSNCYTWEAVPAAPFKNIDEFHAYFLERLRPRCPDPSTYEALEQIRREAQDHAPVLTHGDLAPRNILVKGGRVVSVVDWETFGWYPDFWERMTIENEDLGSRIRQAVTTVFGEKPSAAQVYLYVDACLGLPW